MTRALGYRLATGVVVVVSVGSSTGYLTGALDASILELQLPLYFSKILAFWKLLGVVALLAPVFHPAVVAVKEWAYAGFFFNLSGAVACHLAVGHRLETLPAAVVLTALVTAYSLRPRASVSP